MTPDTNSPNGFAIQLAIAHVRRRFAAWGRVSRIEQLRRQPRKPGEASFFYADHHFQYDAVKVLPGEYYCVGRGRWSS